MDGRTGKQMFPMRKPVTKVFETARNALRLKIFAPPFYGNVPSTTQGLYFICAFRAKILPYDFVTVKYVAIMTQT